MTSSVDNNKEQQQQQRKAGGGRGRPKPERISVLDREALLQALDSKDIVLKKSHVDGFYQALHRCHYPPLDEFVKQYYQNEKDAIGGGDQNRSNGNDNDRSSDSISNKFPLKNAISNKKNRNRISLPKSFLQFLSDPTNGFVTLTSRVAQVKTSNDLSTTKLAIQLHDGQLVESVLMRYGPKIGSSSDDDKTNNNTMSVIEKCGRASLCVSSQVGCAMACNFCATGMMGLTGDLKYSEILEQVIHTEQILGQEAIERRALLQQKQQQNDNNNKLFIPKTTTTMTTTTKQQEQKFSGKQNNNDNNNNNNKNNNCTDLDVVRNIVFMGMGEPLDNYTNVVEACRALIDRKRWNLAHGRVTVSTVGIASKIRKLTKELPEVSLALSLHAPNQTLRSQIVPTAKHYPIEDMIDALDGHMKATTSLSSNKTKKKKASDTDDANASGPAKGSSKVGSRRRAMIEYVMLEGETSTLQCAHELGALCKGKKLVVNLIPYNQTDVRDTLRCPSMGHIKEFQRIVASYGTFCTIRRTMGADIDSACGQLVVLDNNRNKNQKEGLSSSSSSLELEKKKEADILPDIEDGLTTTSTTTSNSNSKAKAALKRNPQQQQPISSCTDQEEEMNSIGTVKARQVASDDLEKWIRPLQMATTLAASCFVLTSVLYLKQTRR